MLTCHSNILSLPYPILDGLFTIWATLTNFLLVVCYLLLDFIERILCPLYSILELRVNFQISIEVASICCSDSWHRLYLGLYRTLPQVICFLQRNWNTLFRISWPRSLFATVTTTWRQWDFSSNPMSLSKYTHVFPYRPRQKIMEVSILQILVVGNLRLSEPNGFDQCACVPHLCPETAADLHLNSRALRFDSLLKAWPVCRR